MLLKARHVSLDFSYDCAVPVELDETVVAMIVKNTVQYLYAEHYFYTNDYDCPATQ